MKKILLTNLFLILGLSVIYGADNPAKYKDGGSPTSIAVRSTFFKAHLDDSKIIFEEMRKWHEEDYAALVQIVKIPENQEKMKIIHDTINKTFKAETVTHGKIAAVYKAYSAIISSKSEMELQENANDAENEETVNDTIQEVIEYCIDNKVREMKEPHVGELPSISSNIIMITLAEKHNVRWLPYVSRKGLSTFRVLNSQFGMKAPLAGLPLERSSFDGNLDQTPFSFFRHEVNHGGYFDADTNAPAVINFIYDCYHEADTIVSQLTDTKIQALCDFFLFEVGHESYFNIQTTWEMDCYKKYERPGAFTLQHPKDLHEACDKILEGLEKSIRKFHQPSPLYSHREIMYKKYIEERKNIEEMRDSVKSMESVIKECEDSLIPFINPMREGQHLFTLIELINKFNLSKEKPLSEKEIADVIQPGFLTTLPPHPGNAFNMWCRLELKLQFYNQLFGYKYFFNKNGIAFDIWKGNVFQADAIVAVFKEACDAFKREVGTKFKGFDGLSTKNWHEEQKELTILASD